MSENQKLKRRTSQITVRLDPRIIDGLSEIGDRLGIAPTTLAGVAIGEYVSKSISAYESPKLLQEAMGKELAQLISAPMLNIFEGKSADEIKKLFDNG